MTSIRFLRILKDLLKHAIPEALKVRIRGRRYGYRRSAVGIPFTSAVAADGATELGIEGIAPLRLPAALAESFEFHLVNNGESIEELYGFLEHARGADGVLFDVGANHGAFSLAFCAARPGSRAVAFEPAAEPLAELGDAIRMNGMEGRIQARQAWIGNEDGEVTGGIDPSGFFSRDLPGGERTVAHATIDGFAAESGLRPSALKIDVDGAELEVLRGARRTLRDARPVVFLELHHDLLHAGGIDSAAVIALLVEACYRFETPLGRALTARAIVHSPAAVLRLVAMPG